MKSFLRWVKDNVIIVISVLLCVASIAVLYFISSWGSAFITTLTTRVGKIATLQGLTKTPVTLPPAGPDLEPQKRTITVNPKSVEQITAVFDQMRQEQTNITHFIDEINSQAHAPFFDGLFPDPGRNIAKVYDARSIYRKALSDLFNRYDSTEVYPQLDAKPGLSDEEVNRELAQFDQNYLANLGRTSMHDLSPTELDTLNQRRADYVLKLLINYAKSTHLFAQTRQSLPGFPFDVPAWTTAGHSTRPTPDELWESQMSLWIISDIARAIQLANGVDNPETNVLSAPVKRLLLASVRPGYAPEAAGSGKADASASFPANFGVSPTGRGSTPLYDVRYVKLVMIVDWHRLPVFFDALTQVNFMSVVQMNVTDVDAYAALREGCDYGAGDPVKVEMLIETIYFHDWTARYMPDEVKRARGVPVTTPPAPVVLGEKAEAPPVGKDASDVATDANPVGAAVSPSNGPNGHFGRMGGVGRR